MGFEAKAKIAAGLLADNNKELTQICVRGDKDGDYEGVKRWYNVLYPNAAIWIKLVSTENKDVL
jgi:hypothetical protein